MYILSLFLLVDYRNNLDIFLHKLYIDLPPNKEVGDILGFV